MNFNVRADLSTGYNVFQGTFNYVPRIGEEIEANGYIFKVVNVRYILKEGSYYGTPVRLTLEQTK